MIMSIKSMLVKLTIMKPIVWCYRLSKLYRVEYSDTSRIEFLMKHIFSTQVIKNKGKVEQLCALIDSVRIAPVGNNSFFYSIDPFKTIEI